MVILADELLEGFFGRDLPASFQLSKTADEDYHQAHQKPEGLLGGLMNLVVTNEWVSFLESEVDVTARLTIRNKNRLNRLADGFGTALGRHAEWRKPSLAKTMPSQQNQMTELGARESLLTPSSSSPSSTPGGTSDARHRSQSTVSQASVKSTASGISAMSTQSDSRSLAEAEARFREESEMVKQAQEAVMARPNFAIDAIGDSDGEDEDDDAADADEGVMDEVEAFLKAHGADDEGLKGEQKKVAEGESCLFR